MKIFHQIINWAKQKYNLLTIVLILAGTTGGFLYYSLVGCRTGTCPITSSPWLSMLWGAAIGYLISDLFRKKEVSGTGNKVDK